MVFLASSDTQPQSLERSFLQLRLDPQTPVLLPMESVQEVLTVASKRLTFLPNMPDSILGLLNQRSRLYWVMDLPQFLGFPRLKLRVQRYTVVILNAQSSSLGLLVAGIDSVVKAPIETIGSPPSGWADYCQGTIPTGTLTLPVLNSNAIVEDSRLSS